MGAGYTPFLSDNVPGRGGLSIRQCALSIRQCVLLIDSDLRAADRSPHAGLCVERTKDFCTDNWFPPPAELIPPQSVQQRTMVRGINELDISENGQQTSWTSPLSAATDPGPRSVYANADTLLYGATFVDATYASRDAEI